MSLTGIKLQYARHSQIALPQLPHLRLGFTLCGAAGSLRNSGVAGIAGKLITGWLMDRVDAGLVGAVTLAVSAAAYGLLLDGIRTLPLTVVAIVVIGYAAAAKMQICAFLTSKHAGMRNFGVIFGFMSSLIALGGGMGPFVAGLVYDHYGSYNNLLVASVAGTFLAAAAIFGLGRYPDWDGPDRVADLPAPIAPQVA